jgi:hypothetical protein
MSAAKYTPEEEALYKLRPLPDVPFIGEGRAKHLNGRYEVGRLRYRETHPHAPKVGE